MTRIRCERIRSLRKKGASAIPIRYAGKTASLLGRDSLTRPEKKKGEQYEFGFRLTDPVPAFLKNQGTDFAATTSLSRSRGNRSAHML